MAKKAFIGPKTELLMGLPPDARPKDMIRKTLYLNGKIYDDFEKLCKKSGKSTSKVINSLISDFVEVYGGRSK